MFVVGIYEVLTLKDLFITSIGNEYCFISTYAICVIKYYTINDEIYASLLFPRYKSV